MQINRFVLVATVKNEGPYLLEWVAHHLLVGFNDIIIFQNDSDDTTDETLKCLQGMGIANYKYNRSTQPGSHQVKAYKRASRQPEYTQADWAMALDLDEFLCIKVGDGTLQDWIKLLPDADVVYVNWRQFGSNSHKTLPLGLTTAAFTLAERSNRLRTGVSPFKSLFRRDKFIRPGIHKPLPINNDSQYRIINGSGVRDTIFETRNFQCSDPECLRYAQVNHYIVRDAASFVLKSYKGSAHQANRPIDRKYWFKRNKNHEEDTTLANRTTQLRAKMNELDKISGGRLSELRERAIAQHKSKLDGLLKDPEMRALYDFCIKHPGTK
jgi:hypothetical protein